MNLRTAHAMLASTIESHKLLVDHVERSFQTATAKNADSLAKAEAAVDFALVKVREYFAEVDADLKRERDLLIDEITRAMGGEIQTPAPVPVFDITAGDSPQPGDPVPLRARRPA